MGCFIEKRLKRLEEERKNALEMAQETNQKTKESTKGKQSLIFILGVGGTLLKDFSILFFQSSFL
jgi:hypothetical protein